MQSWIAVKQTLRALVAPRTTKGADNVESLAIIGLEGFRKYYSAGWETYRIESIERSKALLPRVDPAFQSTRCGCCTASI